MLDPYLDITEVTYSSGKLFNLLLLKDNKINVDDFKNYGINAISFIAQGGNIDANWIARVSSHIEGVRFNNHIYPSLKGLSKFNNLQYFQLIGEVENGEIPFTTLDKLKEVDLVYQDRTCKQIFEQKNIEYLSLGFYKDKLGIGLSELIKLKQLSLNHSTFSDLNFLSNLNELKKIGINYNPKLTKINSLHKIRATLKSFGVQNCRKISDWDILQEMENIEFIYIENCGEIETLSFLKNHPKLRALYIIGSTKILDGKLKEIINRPNIEKVNISIQKNYDIKRDDIRKFDFVPLIKIE